MNKSYRFKKCPICDDVNWNIVYQGLIRRGSGGDRIFAQVGGCSTCGLQQLEESKALDVEKYESSDYRDIVGQGADINLHYNLHDDLAKFTFDVAWPYSFRGASVADVGCGGGVLLDHLSGIAGSLIAIEPFIEYSKCLKEKGYKWYASLDDACLNYRNSLDYVFSTQVIEHVEDPVGFLRGIFKILRVGGVAIISTPNLHDVLMEMLPEEFKQHFYRVQHKWYFTMQTFEKAAIAAGFKKINKKYKHRYGLSNTMHWLNSKKPRGRTVFPGIDEQISLNWISWLEATGKSDNLYLVLEK